MLRDKAKAAGSRGDLAAAKAHLQRAINQDPTDWQAQYMLGVVELEDGRPLAAESHFARAVSIHGRHEQTPKILDMLAESLFRQGEQSRLQEMLRSATQRYGQMRDFIRQSYYLSKIGDDDGAMLALRKAFEFAPEGDPAAHLAAADFYEAIGNQDEAILALRRAYTLDDRNETIKNRLRALGVVPGPTIRLEGSLF